LHEDVSVYLLPSLAVDSDSPLIISKAQELTDDLPLSEQVIRLFQFVRDEILYNPFTCKRDISFYRASHTLLQRQGYCVQKAVLLAALCRAIGIPARIHYANINSYVNKDKLFEYLGTNLLLYCCRSRCLTASSPISVTARAA